MPFLISNKKINKIILDALREDAYKEDITTDLLIPKDKTSRAFIVVKEETVLCGLGIARQIFHKIDKNLKFQTPFKDGQKVKKNTKVAFLRGKAHALLRGERTALNFLAHLSGIATNTRKFLDAVRPLKTIILDTRKTTPGLRILEKYAVCCAGGITHRLDLKESILIKDNHKKTFKDFSLILPKIAGLREKTTKPIACEVENLKELRAVLEIHPQIILLDNFTISQLKKAVKITRIKRAHRPLLEASGGITLKNVRAVARTGVDRISIGALTHTSKFINVSLEIT